MTSSHAMALVCVIGLLCVSGYMLYIAMRTGFSGKLFCLAWVWIAFVIGSIITVNPLVTTDAHLWWFGPFAGYSLLASIACMLMSYVFASAKRPPIRG